MRGERSAPARSDIDPAAIRHVLGDTFILAADFIDEIRFRLAGTRVCALFGRELRGESFNAFWNEASRAQIADVVTAVAEESNAVVAGATGLAEKDAETELELLLLPIRRDGRTRVRALGILTPLEPPYWLGSRALLELELRAFRYVGTGQSGTIPRRSAGNGRPRHRLRVYSGGLEIRPREGAD